MSKNFITSLSVQEFSDFLKKQTSLNHIISVTCGIVCTERMYETRQWERLTNFTSPQIARCSRSFETALRLRHSLSDESRGSLYRFPSRHGMHACCASGLLFGEDVQDEADDTVHVDAPEASVDA